MTSGEKKWEAEIQRREVERVVMGGRRGRGLTLLWLVSLEAAPLLSEVDDTWGDKSHPASATTPHNNTPGGEEVQRMRLEGGGQKSGKTMAGRSKNGSDKMETPSKLKQMY